MTVEVSWISLFLP